MFLEVVQLTKCVLDKRIFFAKVANGLVNCESETFLLMYTVSLFESVHT